MKKANYLKWNICLHFFEYINKGRDKKELIKGLKAEEYLENQRQNTKKKIWFKFGALTYDILNFEIDLADLAYKNNKELLIECMTEAFDNPDSFDIYFS